jgi:ATP-dependent helicase/nuclease subunit B
MADLRLYHSADPEALLLHAAEPFLCAGRPAEPLPLLVVRQGTLRDEVTDRAARAGCVGWLGEPLVVFGELPARLGVLRAPLSARERAVLLRRLARERGLAHLERAFAHPRMLQAVDALLGDLHAERATPERLAEALREVELDGWDARRNTDVVALHAAYLAALSLLPRRYGIPRSDGRDGLALAAELLREQPETVRDRLRRPFAHGDERCAIRVVGLMDLRRGWGLLLDALCESGIVDEICVYLPSGDGAAQREALSDHEVWDRLRARAASVHEVGTAEREPALGLLHDALFRTEPLAIGPSPAVRGVAAPDEEREVAEIARRVKRLIARDGNAPERIAVVMRESRPYAPLVATALRRLGVPVTARLRYAATDSGAVGALLNVLRAAGHGWTMRELMRVAQSPYFSVDLHLGTLRWIGSLAPLDSIAGWEAALVELAARAAADEETEAERRGTPSPERAARALEGLRAFRAVAEPFSRPRPLSQWIEATRAALGCGDRPAGLWELRRNAERVPNTLDDRVAVDAVRLDCRALDTLEALLADWAAALVHDPAADPSLDAAAWYRELLTALEAEEVVLHTTHQRGVQVLEAFAAVGRPWDHLFVVGMSGGAFPADPAPRPLYSHHERTRLHEAGLPLDTQEIWYGREAALFRALAGAARRSLTLSYAYAGADGGARLPSAYFEEARERIGGDDDASWIDTIPGSCVVPRLPQDVGCSAELALFAARAWQEPELREEARAGLAHLRADPAFARRIEHLLHTTRVEHARQQARAITSRRDAVHAWNGRIEDEALLGALKGRFGDIVWSVSRLEAYGNCPWSFFAKQVLNLEAVAEPEDDLDPATRGSLLHLCLERLHRALCDDYGDHALDPVHLPRAEALLREIVPAAMEEMARRGWMGDEALRPAREQEILGTLRRYVRWEMDEHAKESRRATPTRAPYRFEYAFGMDGEPEAALVRDGRTLRLRGRIDRVDALTDPAAAGWLYVVDHKSGASSLSPVGKYEEGAILQLPLYIHALESRFEGSKVWGGAYQVIGKPARPGALHPHTIKKGQVVRADGVRTAEAAARLDAALDHALDHVDDIRGGVFPARIPGCSKSCPSYCDFKDVCREDVQQENYA